MTKTAYKYIEKNIEDNLREEMIKWAKDDSIKKIDKPTNIGKARRLGYKDKKGYVVARVKIKRGGRKRPRRKKGRRSKRQTTRKVVKMSYQWIAESRAARKFENLEVLNSYKLGKKGDYYFYDIILVDPSKSEIKSDKDINWICNPKNRKRAARGLTSAARKSRGLKTRGSKIRPSIRSKGRRGK